jgi:hypothetical protein
MKILFLSILLIIATYASGQNTDTVKAYTRHIEGVIQTRSGNKLSILLNEKDTLIKVGITGNLAKHFEEQIGKFTMNGWMDIAEVKVTKVVQKVVSIDIIEEKSKAEINGKPVDHFKIGKRIKFSY